MRNFEGQDSSNNFNSDKYYWKLEYGEFLPEENLSIDELDIFANNETGDGVILQFPINQESPQINDIKEINNMLIDNIEVTAKDTDGNILHLMHNLHVPFKSELKENLSNRWVDIPKNEKASWNSLAESGWKIEEGESTSCDPASLNFEEIKIHATTKKGKQIELNMSIDEHDNDIHDLAQVNDLIFEELKIKAHKDSGDDVILSAPMEADGHIDQLIFPEVFESVQNFENYNFESTNFDEPVMQMQFDAEGRPVASGEPFCDVQFSGEVASEGGELPEECILQPSGNLDLPNEALIEDGFAGQDSISGANSDFIGPMQPLANDEDMDKLVSVELKVTPAGSDYFFFEGIVYKIDDAYANDSGQVISGVPQDHKYEDDSVVQTFQADIDLIGMLPADFVNLDFASHV